MPLGRIDAADVRDRRAGEVQSASIRRHQRLDDVGVVHLVGTHPVHGCQHLRCRSPPIKFLGHRVDRGGVDERLVALHIEDHRFLGGGSGQLHHALHHRGDALAARATAGARAQAREAPVRGRGDQGVAVGAEHHRLRASRLTAALQHAAKHRPPADVGHHLARQARRLEPGRHRHDEPHPSSGRLRRSLRRSCGHQAAVRAHARSSSAATADGSAGGRSPAATSR